MNEQTFKGHWTELRGRVKEQWGDLTDDDLVLAEGNADKLVGIIERRTGQAREQIEQTLDGLAGKTGDWREQWTRKASKAATAAGQTAKQLAGSAKQSAKQYADSARDYAGTAGDKARDYADSARQQAAEYYGQAGDMAHEQYDAIAESFRAGYGEAERAIRKSPLESVAVALGTGLIAGVVLGLCLRPQR